MTNTKILSFEDIQDGSMQKSVAFVVYDCQFDDVTTSTIAEIF